MKKCTMIALDTSTTITGYAIYFNGVLNKHNIIDLSNYNDSIYRTKQMKLRIIQLLKDLEPDIVVIEANRNNNNVKTVRLLSSIMGVVEGYCLTYDIYYEELPPSQWRKYVKDNEILPTHRDDLKKWSIDKVTNMGISIQTDDESDAILLGQALINYYDTLEKKYDNK